LAQGPASLKLVWPSNLEAQLEFETGIQTTIRAMLLYTCAPKTLCATTIPGFLQETLFPIITPAFLLFWLCLVI
jgi:hypothetical protein